LLVKFIDAEDDYPSTDDALAGESHGPFGKTEMWRVIQANQGASLIAGFNQPVSAAICRERFQAGRAQTILNRKAVVTGDRFILLACRGGCRGRTTDRRPPASFRRDLQAPRLRSHRRKKGNGVRSRWKARSLCAGFRFLSGI
jgi:hypothetical protein